MFGLDTTFTILLLLCILCACVFEFINGFHDTANAVATVIYTNSLKPAQAVVWSGIWNAIGVFGGIGVAMKIVNLLPFDVLVDQDLSHSVSMIMALLLTAIIWNLGTWYFGIPCSSSHTLIGSILGVGIGYSIVSHMGFGEGVKWSEAIKIGMSLLISPLVGFTLTVVVMFILKQVIKNKKFFKEPEPKKKPPFWTRVVLISTCTLVSYSHGKNDGQKGIGLIILILIAFAPAFFAVNSAAPKDQLMRSVAELQTVSYSFNDQTFNEDDRGLLLKIRTDLGHLDSLMITDPSTAAVGESYRYAVRKDILTISKNIGKLTKSETAPISVEQKSQLKSLDRHLRKFTDYSPFWVVVIIALSLGIGTMFGWKRIVKTIGEKIGKEHLNYAQGASAELVAATTIYAASAVSLPVSTTHVLSSGIAGSMVASKGIKNLQGKTIKTIAIAWLLTLPVTIVLACVLFILFRAIS